MMRILKPLFSLRFLKFCTVGVSGVVVNLGSLALLADALGMQVNAASALAIVVSINSNFFINELWTFRDRREASGSILKRWFKFHVVSIVGAAIQWIIFIAANLCWLLLTDDSAGQYFVEGESWFERFVLRPVAEPPDVGNIKYASQLLGIAVATLWNFFANFHWTWKRQTPEKQDD
ncbi:MAG: GtrA family protein [Deltaproteobacteria bacterium]|nr:GtrA family protein [Deltaproteobacteria bacterium]